MSFLILGVESVFAQQSEDAKNFTGRWSVSREVRNGLATGDVIGRRLVFSGNNFEFWKDGKLVHKGKYVLEPDVEPPTINFHHRHGDLKDKSWKGIYSLDGDTLKICHNAPNLEKDRPAAFESKRDSEHVLITFSRLIP